MNFDVQPSQAVVQPNFTERIALYFVRVDHDIRTTSFDLNQVPNYSFEFILSARESDGQPLTSSIKRSCDEFKHTLDDAKHSSGPD